MEKVLLIVIEYTKKVRLVVIEYMKKVRVVVTQSRYKTVDVREQCSMLASYSLGIVGKLCPVASATEHSCDV